MSLRAAVARRVMESAVGQVPVDVLMPDGSLLGRSGATTGSADRPVLEIVRPQALFERLGHHPKIGIGEAYTAGEWRAGKDTDLADLLLPFAERVTTLVPPALSRLRRVVDRPIPRSQRNSLARARGNIEAHYDLGNELFATFLDETLTYSAARFDDARPWSAQRLEDAQLRKVDAVLDLAQVGRGTRVLEIGTGWGTLAIAAARRGARVTTVTLSPAQAGVARDRIAAAGLTNAIDVQLQDYREVSGTYEAIVSVEMIEAVGEEYWPTYFRVLDRCLAPGGVVAIQSILMSHDRYLATRNSYGWIQKHIFPGGLIPSMRAIRETTVRHSRLRVTETDSFGLHYAETLRRWRAQFQERRTDIARLGYDEAFCRTWELYLAYSEAGFASGYLDVAQVRLTRPDEVVA